MKFLLEESAPQLCLFHIEAETKPVGLHRKGFMVPPWLECCCCFCGRQSNKAERETEGQKPLELGGGGTSWSSSLRVLTAALCALTGPPRLGGWKLDYDR